MTDERLEATGGVRFHEDGWARSTTGMSLLVVSLACLAWSVASALLGPFALVPRRHPSGSAPTSWPSGDEL